MAHVNKTGKCFVFDCFFSLSNRHEDLWRKRRKSLVFVAIWPIFTPGVKNACEKGGGRYVSMRRLQMSGNKGGSIQKLPLKKWGVEIEWEQNRKIQKWRLRIGNNQLCRGPRSHQTPHEKNTYSHEQNTSKPKITSYDFISAFTKSRSILIPF